MSLIKQKGHTKSLLKPFDLLGKDEVALAKAFSYTISNDYNAFFSFLKIIGLNLKKSNNTFLNTSIQIEKVRDEGRTDIEIKNEELFHIIIECKVRKNMVKSQRKKYLTSFNKSETIKKILCFITQERDANIEQVNDIKLINLSWLDIIENLNQKSLLKNNIVKEFLEFSSRNYKMNTLKEILIQDLSDKTEMTRFKDHCIYKRDETFGTPLYFAPYFTKKAKQIEGEGIPYLSKVLGVLTLNPDSIDSFKEELSQFTKKEELIKKWIEGVSLSEGSLIKRGQEVIQVNQSFTYYFLDMPLKLGKNLVKEGGIDKGRGKGWIAASIPKNRSVSFSEFASRMINED